MTSLRVDSIGRSSSESWPSCVAMNINVDKLRLGYVLAHELSAGTGDIRLHRDISSRLGHALRQAWGRQKKKKRFLTVFGLAASG